MPFEDVEYGISMRSILNLLRLRTWPHLETTDARRHPKPGAKDGYPGRVVIPNVPEAAYWALTKKLMVLARESGAKGDILWRYEFEQPQVRNVDEKLRSCLTLTTYKPVAYLFSLETVCDTEPGAAASSGHGVLRVLSSGDIAFIDLPVHVEGIKTVVNDFSWFDLVVSFGIGVIPNANGPPCRHASGYEEYDAAKPPPDWKIWPVLPPYDSFVDYVKFHIGKMVVQAATHLESVNAVRRIESCILQQATIWSHPDSKPRFSEREYYHNPKLTATNMGSGSMPDHQKERQRKKDEEIVARRNATLHKHFRLPALKSQLRTAVKVNPNSDYYNSLVEEYYTLTNGEPNFHCSLVQPLPRTWC